MSSSASARLGGSSAAAPPSPPTQSTKALELLHRSKSLMGFVEEELDQGSSFTVPGHETLSLGSLGSGMSPASSASSAFALDTLHEVPDNPHQRGEGEEAELDPSDSTGPSRNPTSGATFDCSDAEGGTGRRRQCQCFTMRFRVALVASTLALVLAACVLVTVIALVVARDLSDDGFHQCSAQVDGFSDTVTEAVIALGIRGTATSLADLRNDLESGIIGAPMAATALVQSVLKFARFSDPSFTGEARPPVLLADASAEELERSWNASIGPALRPALLAQSSANLQTMYAGWGYSNEVAAVFRVANGTATELCLLSPDCRTFADAPEPDFASGGAVSELIVNFTASASYQSQLALVRAGRAPAAMWIAQLAGAATGGNSTATEANSTATEANSSSTLQLTFVRPADGCGAAEERTASGACVGGIVGAQVSTAGMSCFVRARLEADRARFRERGVSEAVLAGARMFAVFNGVVNVEAADSGAEEEELAHPAPLAGSLVGSAEACDSVGSPTSSLSELLSGTELAEDYDGDAVTREAAAYVREALLLNASWGFGHLNESFAGLVRLPSGETCTTLNAADSASASASATSCFFLAAVPVTSPRSGTESEGSSELGSSELGSDELDSRMEMVGVVVYPEAMYLDALVLERDAQNAQQAQLRVQHDDDWRSLAWLLAGVIAGVMGLVCCVTVLFSYRFGRSLVGLSSKMRKLGELQISTIATEDFSHIFEIQRMQHNHNDMCATIRAVSRFVPSTVVRGIVQNASGKGRRLHVVRKRVTILFSDIEGFTSISEALPEKDLLLFLTTYLTVQTAVVEAYGGVVGEVLGDGILAYWNSPDDVAEHQAKACASALAQQQAMAHINARFAQVLAVLGKPRFAIRIGLHTGTVLSGTIGSKSKWKFGCIGDAVNLAARMEGICKLYGTEILLSEATFQALPGGMFVTREVDLVAVKGKSMPVRIYELVAMRRQLSADRAELASMAAATSLHTDTRKDGCKDKDKDKDQDREAKSKLFAASLRLKASARFLHLSPNLEASPENNNGALADAVVNYGPVRDVPSALVADITAYEAALHCFQAGKLAEARDTLQTVAHEDKARALLLSRIDAAMHLHGDSLAAHALPAWLNGVLKLDSKEF